VAVKLGLPRLLGPACGERDLALALIVSRVVRPGSKLSTLAWPAAEQRLLPSTGTADDRPEHRPWRPAPHRRGRAGAHADHDLRTGGHVPDRLPREGEGKPVPAGRGAELGGGALVLGKRQAEKLAVGAACDGSAFPVLPQALRPATAKAAQARAQAAAESGWPDDPADLRKSRKRTAELAVVADIPSAPRTPGDVLTALFGPPRPGRDEAPRPAPGPEAQGKTVYASVCRPAAEVITDAFAEADRRDPEHARPWIAVIDGNCHQIETVTRLAAERGVKVKILMRPLPGKQAGWQQKQRDHDSRYQRTQALAA